jgi:GBP family porin
MKKAWAVFGAVSAFAGCARAEPTASVYGVIDLSFQELKSGDQSPRAGRSLLRMADGSAFGPQSRWGVRAQEDIGSGLKAGAVLEGGVAADTGAAGNGGRLFGRKSYIWLSSTAAGEIRLGRQFILHDEVQGLSNPFGNTTVMNPGAGAINSKTGTFSLFIDAPRIDNYAQYISPSMGGVVLQAAISPGEGLVDLYRGVKASYSSTRLNLAASYEWSKARIGIPGASAGGDSVNKILEVAGNFQLGRFRLFGGYQIGNDITTGSGSIITAPATAGGAGSQIGTLTFPGLNGPATGLKAFTYGVSTPVGPVVVGANYSLARFEDAAGAIKSLGRYGVAVIYALSKQTSVYAGACAHTGDMKDFINEKKVIQLGLRKVFL